MFEGIFGSRWFLLFTLFFEGIYVLAIRKFRFFVYFIKLFALWKTIYEVPINYGTDKV